MCFMFPTSPCSKMSHITATLTVKDMLGEDLDIREKWCKDAYLARRKVVIINALVAAQLAALFPL